MFTKDEIKQAFLKKKADAIAQGKKPPKANINLALLIMASALFSQEQRSGEDYGEHPIHVAFNDTRSTRKNIVGILHDVVEDSDWTLDDLREIGFSERIVRGVDALTSRDDEPYFDFIVRCGLSYHDCEFDAIDNKLRDLDHNSVNTRYPHIFESEKQVAKRMAYNISYFYLIEIKKGKIKPETPITDFIASRPEYTGHPALVNSLLDKFSSETKRFGAAHPAPQLG